MRRPVNLPTTGKLDKDSDLQYIKSSQGDYPELVDMEFSEENVYALTTAAGNKQILDFGRVDVQDQKIRVYWGGADAKQLQLALYNTNDQLLNQSPIINFDGSLINFKSSVQSIVKNNFPYNSLFDSTATNTDPYIDFTLFTSGSDWYLKTYGCTTAVLREAISVTGTGEYIPIGSYDLLGDVFYWLTTQRNYKSILDKKIFNAYRLQTGKTYVVIFDHGLTDGESIAINGVQGCEGVNGIWVIRVVNKDTIELLMSDFKGVYTKNQDGTVIYKNLYGYGCIGVAQQSQIWGFTPLLRSKKLNFVTKSEIYQPQIEVNGGLISMYYTDNYNLPRVTYYRGPYVIDGCIEALYPKTGQYQYDTLDLEIANQLIYSNYELTFDRQLQSGGKLRAGNKRYAIRFVSESLATTELSLTTNPIPVFSQPYEGLSTTNFVWGDNSDKITTKRNILNVKNIRPGLFKYIELICFEYIGTNTNVLSTSAIVVRRELLTSTQTEITLEHNGNETSTTNFDATTASQVQPKIVTARDNVIIQNRLVYGNVNIATDQYDLTDFCKTLKYSLHKKPIPASSYLKTNGEYYNPIETESSIGYQAWEWYRFYIVGEYLTGSLSSAFFAFDVRFVTKDDYQNPNPDTNFISPFPLNNSTWEFRNTNLTDRRILANDTFDNYDLSDNQVGFGGNLYQLYLKLENVDWNYNVNGVPLKNIFRSFKVYRAERVDEVLMSGFFNKAQVFTSSVNNNDQKKLRDFLYSVRNTALSSAQFNLDAGGGIFWQNLPYPYNFMGSQWVKPNYGSFYAPDYYFLNSINSYSSGDLLISYGQAYQSLKKIADYEQNKYGLISYFSFYTGMTNCKKAGVYKVDELKIANSSSVLKMDNNVDYYKDYRIWGAGPTGVGNELGSYVLKLNKNVKNDGSQNAFWDVNLWGNYTFNGDTAFYNSVYLRRLVDKYGSTINSNNDLTYTNSEILYGNSVVDVLGGDVFTQLTYLKKFAPYKQSSNWKQNGLSAGVEFVSQNKVNTNLRIFETGKQVFPQQYGTDVRSWLNTDNFDYFQQNSGYQIKNRVQARAIYDSENTKENENVLPTRKYYSELKPNGSKIDLYRIFWPISFADNPQGFGPISRVLNVNNELFTVQARGYTREYFNSRGQLISPDSGQILIGDGSVLSRIGTNLTQFGTDHSGGVVIGKSQSGKDVVMFISPEFSQVLRFGDDGLVSVSLREFMRTFFNKNLTWAINAKTPADGNGICGIWDNRNKQFIFTVKAWTEYGTWDKTAYYGPGVYVIYGVNDQGVPYIWYPTGQIKPNEPPPSFTNSKWKAVPFTDNNFYNVYTFTWSELKAGFTQFYSFLPNHYTRWQGSVITPYPNLESPNRNKAYLHGVGNPSEFYDIQFDGGKISLVCNALRDNNKKFFALWMNASNKPERVDISSLFRNEPDGETIKKSYLLSTDFETREGYQISPVKLETDTNGSNDGDTGQMEGIWARFDITFPKGKKTNLYDMIVHIRDSFRTFTS